jgi:hypothetical protein
LSPHRVIAPSLLGSQVSNHQLLQLQRQITAAHLRAQVHGDLLLLLWRVDACIDPLIIRALIAIFQPVENLLATARRVSSGEADLEAWRGLPDEELRARLCQLPGVGAKVANCVMLFAYERLRAFPIDVWIERVLQEQYFAGKKKVTPRRLREFCDNYFGEHGGYAQQYLFHHARKTATRKRRAG